MLKPNENRVRFKLAIEPHSDKQKLVMNAFFIPGLLEMWIACGTKWGKTLSLSSAMSLAAPLGQQEMSRWIAPIYLQSLIGYRYMKRMLPPEPYIKCNESGPSISFPGNDSTIQFLHGQNPESIEGEASARNVLDEAAKLKAGVYDSVKTTTTVTEGPIVGASTPKGKNWFWRKCMEAKEEMIAAKHEGRRPRKIFIHAPTWSNPNVSKIVIEDARKTLPKRVFSQLYEAAFLDDGSLFLYLVDAFGNPHEWPDEQTWFLTEHSSRHIFVGADWAKQNDFTNFYAFNEQGQELGHKRFNRVKYPAQVASLKAFCDEVKRRSTNKECYLSGLHDKTGVGEAIDDIMQAMEFPYDFGGVTWNNTNKEAAVNDLILSFEELCLKMRPWETARNELGAFEATSTHTGKARYAAPEGMHDDTVMSLILANMLYREGRNMVTSVITIDEINNMVKRLYYEADRILED